MSLRTQTLFLYYYLLMIVLLNLPLPHPICHEVRPQQIISKIMSGLVFYFLKFCISNIQTILLGVSLDPGFTMT